MSTRSARRTWRPALAVVLVASLLAGAPGRGAEAQTASFTDVPTSHPFFADIEWLVDAGVTTGYDDGTYRPTLAVSRQVFAAFVFRYVAPEGFTPPATPSFSDVPATSPFFEAVEWLATTGITTGFTDGTFRPTATITRQSMAAFFFRLEDPATWTAPATPTFGDVPTTNPFFSPVEWLATTGITTGFTDGTFRPTSAVTRQSTAAFFRRYDDAFGTETTVPPDPATVAPAIVGTLEPTVYSLTRFLWADPDPIQRDVAGPDTIDPDLAAAVRGQVTDPAGEPVPGAIVEVVDHPELGSTRTQADGRFDLVVNGDAHRRIQVRAEGHPTVQRLARTQPNQWTQLETIVVTPFDDEATVIDADDPDPQVHEASPVSDEDGDRTAAVLFPAGTGAEMVLPDGSRTPLDTLTVRATEYTVGAPGPDAMPGELPASSDYTYAVELSVDEAEAAGATSVEFDQPVVNYVDNFIGFPAGVAVPTGSFDRTTGHWVPEVDGVVLDVVGEADGRAELDVDDDGGADPGQYAALGIDDAELEVLAGLYDAGDSIWRVEIPHFTPWDHNFFATCDPGPCNAPPDDVVPDDQANDPTEDGCTKDGSVVACLDQVLGEQIAVTGTPYELNSWSDRARANASGRGIEIRLTSGTPPPNVERIDLRVEVAGQLEVESFVPEADLTTTFEWDGLDGYGRPYPASVFARIEVEYVYDAAYRARAWDPGGDRRSFGNAATGFSGGYDRVANEFRAGRIFTRMLDNRDALDVGVGGWTFDVHHRLDPQVAQLIMGDGSSRNVGQVLDQYIVEPVAGDGTPCDDGPCGDGGPATSAQLGFAIMAVDGDGTLWFHDPATRTIRRVAADGTIDSVYGDGTACTDNPATACGTGGPASGIVLAAEMSAMTFDGDGNLYLVEDPTGGCGEECGPGGGGAGSEGPTVRRITADGQVEAVAGDGSYCEIDGIFSCGNAGPAVDAGFEDLDSIVVTDEGVVYLNEGLRIRQVVDGWITHAYGCASFACEDEEFDEGVDAALTELVLDDEMTIDPYGNLVIGDFGPLGVNDDPRIRRIDPDTGVVVTLAGGNAYPSCTPTQTCGDNGPAIDAYVSGDAVAVDAEGYVFTAGAWQGGQAILRRFFPGGAIYRVAGGPEPCFVYSPGTSCGDFGPARDAGIRPSRKGLVSSPDGRMYVYSGGAGGSNSIRALTRRDEVVVPSTDGAEAYVFTQAGQHLATRDTLTGAVLHSFGYDPDGRLVSITDRDGKVTTVEREADGTPTAIVAPYGQTTTLTTTPIGELATVADPGGNTHSMTYVAPGLLATFTDPAGGTSTFTYDAEGRLIRDEDAAGGSLTLERFRLDGPGESGTEVEVTTEEGRTTTYRVLRDKVEPIVTREVEGPAGDVVRHVVDHTEADPVITTVQPTGVRVDMTYRDDPRFGEAVRTIDTLVATTAGPSPLDPTVTTYERTVTVPPGGDPLAPTAVTETEDTNGRVASYAYDGASRTETWTSPEGRVETRVRDERARVVQRSTGAGMVTEVTTYDDDGRVTARTADGRATTYGYDGLGRLATVTDPAGEVTTFGYDDADRRTSTALPSGATWTTAYDPNGNPTTVTMPDGEVHGFTHDAVDQPTSFTDPGQPPRTQSFSPDRQLTSVGLPDGRTIARGFGADGRYTGDAMAAATTSVAYAGGTTLPRTLTYDQVAGPDQSIELAYDGLWVTQLDLTGAAVGTYDYGIDADRWIESVSVTSGADGTSFAVSQDDDGLLTGWGPFTLDRSGPAGRTAGIADGTATTSIGWDAYGETTGRDLTVGATTVHDVTYTRDAEGQITGRTTTTPSGTRVETFAYDADDRLVGWTVAAEPTVTYAYDGNGNPTTGPSGAATFDDDDRVVDADGATRTYDASGFLTNRGAGTFTWSARGELLEATAGGETVTYAYDAMGRRTARTDGEGTTQYLYGNPDDVLQVTAVRNPDDSFDVLVYDDLGNLHGFQRDGVQHYVGVDQAGTPVVVATADGTVVKERTFDPWGNLLADSDPSFPLALGFAAGLDDPVTGLVRFGQRDYDPATGHWTARDPIGFAGGPNLFGYVHGNPVNLTDPSGLAAFCLGGSGYYGIGGGAEYCVGDDFSWSLCAEVGVGVGGGVTGTFGDVAQAGVAAGAEAGFDCLGTGAGAGAEISATRCGVTADACGSGQVVSVGVKSCMSGQTTTSFGQIPDELKCSAAAKLYTKGCLAGP